MPSARMLVNLSKKNVLIINFGQIGDVVMSLPALEAVRTKFPLSNITVMVGKSAKDVIELANIVDEIVVVDRVKLRDRNKILSIREIIKLIFKIRRKRYDFAIDLHSLYETNLIGFLSGARLRLFGNRGKRSLNFLSNFRPKPPFEDKSLHLADYYLKNLEPLGIKDNKCTFRINPPDSYLEKVKSILRRDRLESKSLVGVNLGAGNPSRHWNLEKFACLTQRFLCHDNLQVLVFCGPEEDNLQSEIKEKFSSKVIIYNELNLKELTAFFSRLKVLIGNDTGPLHLGAMVGTPIVLIIDKNAPLKYLPLTKDISVVRNETLDKISVEDVFEATRSWLVN